MKLFNCHTHTDNSHDCKARLRDIYKEALKAELTGFAVTDHCDCEYAENIKMVNDVLHSYDEADGFRKNHNKIKLLCGIEIGEVLSDEGFAKEMLSARDWDMVLCSVHAVNIPDFEMPFSMIDFSDKSDAFIDRYVTQYFAQLLDTAIKADYDVLCHLTVILRYVVYKYNRSVDIKKHYPVIRKILEAVIARDKTLEINTSGIDDGYFMPDREILEMYKALGGKRVTVGSDAHFPENISAGLSEAAAMLKELGFDSLTCYEKRKPMNYFL